MKLLIGTDQLITISDLKDENGDLLTGANVSVTVNDISGNEVAGDDWPVPFQDEGGGVYKALLENDLEIIAGQNYFLLVVAEYGGKKRTWREKVMAQYGTLSE